MAPWTRTGLSREEGATKSDWSGEPQVGNYRLLRVIASGAFGEVWAAECKRTGRRAALKRLTQVHPSSLLRFKKEFRALCELRHPNLVQMYELFEHQGGFQIAMELVEGPELLEWVRIPADGDRVDPDHAPFDERRIRAACVDLAHGLRALHDAGLVHRDLKPSNVRVSEGRAVLLDFGMISTLGAAESTHDHVVGTAAYMAPEQAVGARVGPPADYYALGVCLYEVLTGRLPFEGPSALAILMDKQGALPSKPSEHVAQPRWISHDLESLCMRLLCPDPEQRAGYEDVLEVCTQPTRRELEPSAFTSATGNFWSRIPGPHLVGREVELKQLREAYAQTQRGELRVVVVQGESGIGKSSLVYAFADTLQRENESAWMLRGRCYENEQVPYKAFDGCMDCLMQALRRLPTHAARALLPPRSALLSQLFPVLSDVPAIATASLKGLSVEPSARRHEAFRALSSLLHKVGEARPLVLIVDDLQWADAESFRLLGSILQDAPPLLLLFTVRSEEELASMQRGELSALLLSPSSTLISLSGLDAAEARRLTHQLVGPDAPSSWTRSIVDESAGHPLFIEALIQYALSGAAEGPGGLSLEAALRTRSADLPHLSRQLLELLALAGRPCDRTLLAPLLDGPLEDALDPLLARKLARTRGQSQLVCAHDRVRTTVTASLEGQRRKELHRVLANALSRSPDADLAQAGFHFQEAGQPERAAEAYGHAAERALAALAFSRAADLCAMALALSPSEDESARQQLIVRRAHALAYAGKSAEAATLYGQAAEKAEGETRVQLRVAAIQHLLQSAQVSSGMDSVHDLLDELGIGGTRSTWSALSSVAWRRAKLALRGRRRWSTEHRGADLVTQQRLEAAQRLAGPLSWVDTLSGANLNAALLERALDVSDRAQAARALALEGLLTAVRRPLAYQRYTPMLEEARALQRELGDPALDAFITYAEAMTSMFRTGFVEGERLLLRAETLLREHCSSEPWQLTNIRAGLGMVWSYTGAHGRLVAESEIWLAQARERDDLFARTLLNGVGFAFMRHLMVDTPDAAVAEIEEVLRPWPARAFSGSDMCRFNVMAGVESYRGGTHLYNWLEQERGRHDRAWIFKAAPLRAQLDDHRGRGALAMLAGAPRGQRARLRRSVQVSADRLKRSKLPVAEVAGRSLEAQLLMLDGDQERALLVVHEACRRCEQLGVFPPFAYLEGLLQGGETGRELCQAVLKRYAAQGWKRPERAVARWLTAVSFE